MSIDLDAYMIISVGGRAGTELRDMENLDDKYIETVKAQLCTCAKCGKNERIVSEDVTWLSMNEVFDAIRQGRVLSDNPETLLILKVLEWVLRK
jgi:hypothetical protein